MESICKLRSLLGLSHFENCINLNNAEKVIKDQYRLFTEKMEYDELKTLSSDFYNRNSEISLCYLFQNAIEYATHCSHGQAYFDIKNILFEMIKSFEQIVFLCNKIVLSAEVVLCNFISSYKCLSCPLSQDYEYENAAYAILESLTDYQTENIYVPLKQIAVQPNNIKSTIETTILEYIPLQEKFETDHIMNLRKPIFLLETSLPEIHNTMIHVLSFFEKIKGAVKSRLMHNYRETHSRSWENPVTKKLFLKYYSNLLALCQICKDVKSIFKDLLLNFQSFIHEI